MTQFFGKDEGKHINSAAKGTVTASLQKGFWYAIIEALLDCGAIPKDAHRVLLHGPPGTGKTTCPFKLLGEQRGQEVESVTLHQQMPPDDLIGSMGLVEKNGATVTVWQDGPSTRAMKRGGPLVINEISRRSPECESSLYNILDDLSICSVTLPNGETVKPSPGYVVFATMNDDPSCLPEAIQERFDIVLLCKTPAPGILEGMPVEMARLVNRHYETIKVKQWKPGVGVRSVMAANRLSGHIGRDAAFQLKFGQKEGVDVLASIATGEGK